MDARMLGMRMIPNSGEAVGWGTVPSGRRVIPWTETQYEFFYAGCEPKARAGLHSGTCQRREQRGYRQQQDPDVRRRSSRRALGQHVSAPTVATAPRTDPPYHRKNWLRAPAGTDGHVSTELRSRYIGAGTLPGACVAVASLFPFSDDLFRRRPPWPNTGLRSPTSGLR